MTLHRVMCTYVWMSRSVHVPSISLSCEFLLLLACIHALKEGQCACNGRESHGKHTTKGNRWSMAEQVR